MSLDAHTAGSVSNDVNFVTISQSLNSGHRQTYFGPQSGHDDFPPAGLLHPLDDARILPRIDERTVNGLLFGKDILNGFEELATLLFKDRRKEGRHADALGRFV